MRQRARLRNKLDRVGEASKRYGADVTGTRCEHGSSLFDEDCKKCHKRWREELKTND